SIPRLPPKTEPALRAAVARMKLFEPAGLPKGELALADPGRDYLVYASTGDVQLDLTATTATFAAFWINPKTGERTSAGDRVAGGRKVEFPRPASGPSLLWLTRK